MNLMLDIRTSYDIYRDKEVYKKKGNRMIG